MKKVLLALAFIFFAGALGSAQAGPPVPPNKPLPAKEGKKKKKKKKETPEERRHRLEKVCCAYKYTYNPKFFYKKISRQDCDRFGRKEVDMKYCKKKDKKKEGDSK